MRLYPASKRHAVCAHRMLRLYKTSAVLHATNYIWQTYNKFQVFVAAAIVVYVSIYALVNATRSVIDGTVARLSCQLLFFVDFQPG